MVKPEIRHGFARGCGFDACGGAVLQIGHVRRQCDLRRESVERKRVRGLAENAVFVGIVRRIERPQAERAVHVDREDVAAERLPGEQRGARQVGADGGIAQRFLRDQLAELLAVLKLHVCRHVTLRECVVRTPDVTV